MDMNPAEEHTENEVESTAPTPSAPPNQEPSDSNSKKNILIAALLLVIIALVGYLLLGTGNDEPTTANSSQEGTETDNPTDSSELVEEENAGVLGNIVYAHSDTDNAPRPLFSRAASGGDRTDIEGSVSSQVYPSNVSRGSNSYAYYDRSDNSIWYGEGENSPVNIYSVEDGTDVTQIAYSEASATIAISTTESIFQQGITNPVRKITTFGIDGQNVNDVLTADAPSSTSEKSIEIPFVVAVNGDTNQVIFRSSCYNCDGYNADLYLLESDGTYAEIYDAGGYTSSVVFGDYSVNSDFSKVLFIDATAYTDAQVQEYNVQIVLGSAGGPPFELISLDIASGTATTLATFGDIEDIRGEFNVAAVSGWTTTDRPYYTYQNLVFAQNGTGGFDNVFETGQGDIVSVYAVTDNEVLVGSGTSEGEVISYFNILEQSAATVMETTFSTAILNVIVN